MVRLRSSSNAEDGLAFSGAGLYESASACLADSTDADGDGPSRCDPDKDDERTVEDALRTVWASLWSEGAWEERAWYGIDPLDVAMGVLVNEQSEDEEANIVAFTGTPTAADARWPGQPFLLVVDDRSALLASREGERVTGHWVAAPTLVAAKAIAIASLRGTT